MAFDGTNFGVHLAGLHPRLDDSDESVPMTDKCGGCGLPIVKGKLVCEVCKDMANLGVVKRNNDWASGTMTNHGNVLSRPWEGDAE